MDCQNYGIECVSGLALIAFLALSCDGAKPVENCITIKDFQTIEIPPAGVRSVFRLEGCDHRPIADLKNNELELLLDGAPVQTEGDVGSVLTQEFNFDNYVLLLLDMSNSVVDNGNLQPMVDAAMKLVHRLTDLGHKIAVYRFAGPAYFAEVHDFSSDEDSLDEALTLLLKSTGLGTTDLYGSIPRALDILESTGNAEILTTRTLVLFTDGRDEAMAGTADNAQSAVNGSSANVFSIGLGGDVDREELLSFGKDGFEWVEDPEALEEGFIAIVERITNLARSHYLIGVCSPRVGGTHELTLNVTRGNEAGSLTVFYNADGFDIVGCDSQEIAFPCGNQDCGYVEGISCGTCVGTEYCSDDFLCEEACPIDIECGVNAGVDCGNCSEYGPTVVCQKHKCIDACRNEACGTILGIDCGDCSELGPDFGCDENHDCVDACDGAECGTFFGVDCGDCSEFGTDFGCDENYRCVEACQVAECGTYLGVYCGDCAGFGDTHYCEANNCVDACENAECGTVQGVHCGDCDSGFECNSSHICVPLSLPSMNWVNIEGGDVTLGCDVVLDPSCGLDEPRHEVTLSSYWIMDTEVTVEMYRSCVSDGGCNLSYLDTAGECNWSTTPSFWENHPINCIAYDGMKQFCAYVGGQLPTEAQWERALRSDHDDVLSAYWIYGWGNSPSPSCSRVVMNEGGPGCGQGGTHQVGQMPSTSFGLSNMVGNVSEWTRDFYSDSFNCDPEGCVDPSGPPAGTERVVRGGSWSDFFDAPFRNAARDKKAPGTTSPGIGGRCVK